MLYFTYKTTLKGSDKYYVGRHSTNTNLEKDKYVGSGSWVNSIKEKSLLQREVLAFYASEEELMLAEAKLLRENIGKLGCMNFNENPVGFSSKNNPNKTKEGRERSKKRCIEDNPVKNGHRLETIEKIKKAMTGRHPSNETRKKLSDSLKGKNFGKRWTEEQRKNHSKLIKQEYQIGKRLPIKNFLGRKHSQETLQKMKQAHANRSRKICEYCQKNLTFAQYVRWHGQRCKLRDSIPDKFD